MDVLSRVLLHMESYDADATRTAVVGLNVEEPAGANRHVELRNLVAFRQIGIHVVLSIELRGLGDRAVEREPRKDRAVNESAVEHGQRAWEAHAYRTDARVWLSAESILTGAERLRGR